MLAPTPAPTSTLTLIEAGNLKDAASPHSYGKEQICDPDTGRSMTFVEDINNNIIAPTLIIKDICLRT